MPFEIVRNDITKMAVDAIVNEALFAFGAAALVGFFIVTMGILFTAATVYTAVSCKSIDSEGGAA